MKKVALLFPATSYYVNIIISRLAGPIPKKPT